MKLKKKNGGTNSGSFNYEYDNIMATENIPSEVCGKVKI